MSSMTNGRMDAFSNGFDVDVIFQDLAGIEHDFPFSSTSATDAYPAALSPQPQPFVDNTSSGCGIISAPEHSLSPSLLTQPWPQPMHDNANSVPSFPPPIALGLRNAQLPLLHSHQYQYDPMHLKESLSLLEYSASESTVHPPKLEDYPANNIPVGDFGWSNLMGNSSGTSSGTRPSGPISLQLPSQQHTCAKRVQPQATKHQCPVCQRNFKRRDNIKPHVRRKHRHEYESLYASSCATTGGPSPSPAAQYSPAPTQSPANCSLESGGCTPAANAFPNEPESARLGRLACPFQKANVYRYQRCLNISLQRIKDVKQHIYRNHAMPENYCANCYEVFDTARARDEHSRQRNCDSLAIPSSPHFEGITEDQMRELKKKSSRALSEEQQWLEIWGIIFSDRSRPKSVYVGDVLAELAPLLREKWNQWALGITAQAGGVEYWQLGLGSDDNVEMFFKSLED